jgi:hypothetical protein
LAFALGWLARTQRKTGKTIEAGNNYYRAASILRYLVGLTTCPKATCHLRHYLATTLFGYAKILREMGDISQARMFRKEASLVLAGYLPQRSFIKAVH